MCMSRTRGVHAEHSAPTARLQQPHRLCLLVLQRRELRTQPTHRVVEPLRHGRGARRVREE
jgi:hypothetical protein